MLFILIKIGLTCIGSIYEYNLIVQWLKDHDTDPMTNLILPTKFVRKFKSDHPNIEVIIKDTKLTLEAWYNNQIINIYTR